MIEIDAATGEARAVITEEPKTFFYYSGKKFRHDLEDGKEIIWMSERDGWNHLYLFDGATGAVKNQITKGDWPVRGVVQVDEKARQIWFSASGMYPGKDPYFVHYYRINFDGTGLTPLTTADANHTVVFSPDCQVLVDTYSRVDLAPVTELRAASDGALVTHARDRRHHRARKAGWKAPEVFVGKGRDGKTDIWGVIFRPTNFDPAKKYPVIENIYAGPQGSFVPKSFGAFNAMQAQAELGFIVVQIDGMGTSNRSKAFHDVAWKNLKDAGFPDRILWHKAAAAKYPYYDITPRRASTARPPAARTRSAGCCSSRSSTRPRCRPPAATTTGWTRSGGTSSGWDGRSARTTPRRPTSTMPTGCRATCCWSSARWTTTSIRRRPTRWSIS